jgi:hypothetical protein
LYDNFKRMPSKQKKNLGGRPTKFDPGLIPRVRKFMLMGATMVELADFLEVDRSQVHRWMEKNVEFRNAVKNGREEADANVAKAMYKRATGMKIKATKIFYDKDAAAAQRFLARELLRKMKINQLETTKGYKLTEEEIAAVNLTAEELANIDNALEGRAGVVAVPYYEVLAPDVKAGTFWLTNRRGDSWKEKQEINQNVSAEVTHSIEWEEAPNCEPLKTAEELEAEAELENPHNVTDEEQH